MTDTIRSLFNGNLSPIQYFGTQNRELMDLQQLLSRNSERITQLLSEEGQKVLSNYEDCYHEYCAVSVEQAFCDGFCLAVRIMTEAMSGEL